MAKHGSRVSGRLSRAELEELVHNGEVETVVTVIPDLYGRLVGKRISGHFFLSGFIQKLSDPFASIQTMMMGAFRTNH
jgi:hypothetical protein